MQRTKLKAPFGWVGGKSKLAPDIIKLIPKEHEKLADLLSKMKGKFLLSYNDNIIVRELYKGFNIQNTKKINYTLGANANGNKKIVNELFITNY